MKQPGTAWKFFEENSSEIGWDDIVLVDSEYLLDVHVEELNDQFLHDIWSERQEEI